MNSLKEIRSKSNSRGMRLTLYTGLLILAILAIVNTVVNQF